MHFLTSLPHRHRVINPVGTAALSGDIRALAGSDAVREVALHIASRLHMAGGPSGRAHVRALPDGGLEMLLISTGGLRLDPFAHDPGVTVIADQWQDEKGSCALVRILAGHGAVDLPFGVIEQSLGDAPFSGDAWALSAAPAGLTVLVIDGLGHGPLAQNAAVAGVEALRSVSPGTPSDHLRQVHDALRGTVGAAAAVARVAGQGVVDFSGVGNIEATLVTGERRAGLVSHPGVAGHGKPEFRLFRHVLSGKSLLVMHTDGLHAHWSPARYPGLFARHPALVAGVLFRDCWRPSDDALVVVFDVSDDVHARFSHLPG
jgi:hypothetical protein